MRAGARYSNGCFRQDSRVRENQRITLDPNHSFLHTTTYNLPMNTHTCTRLHMTPQLFAEPYIIRRCRSRQVVSRCSRRPEEEGARRCEAGREGSRESSGEGNGEERREDGGETKGEGVTSVTVELSFVIRIK